MLNFMWKWQTEKIFVTMILQKHLLDETHIYVNQVWVTEIMKRHRSGQEMRSSRRILVISSNALGHP